MAEKVWLLCKVCGKKSESYFPSLSCLHCGSRENLYSTTPPWKPFYKNWNWGPFYKPMPHAMRRFQVWWVLTKCFFSKHDYQGNYGAHAEGWGTKYACWWCGKQEPGKPGFKRDEEVDPIPGPLPGCHPSASEADKDRFKRVV